MNDGILWLELLVGIIVSFSLLGIFIWAVRQGQFDDGKKMMNGLLFDSTEDLQDAVRKEQKIKELKENKAKSNKEAKEKELP
jgi:cbb3-type cytochrome oxidase maturation protein